MAEALPALAAGGLRIVALGGLGEIGRNMTVFECDGQLLIVDCGVISSSAGCAAVPLVSTVALIPCSASLPARRR